ncbi:hypothetical protein [Streptomyces apocyni]|uniref:hypothetical protein n=1 Tax=Streptomyces apocyni TaxID=2654677 RepID=UPI0012EA3734|nr:hypothetical protein [Streptomyces apocyni]
MPEARTFAVRRRPRTLTLRLLGVWLFLIATVLGTGTAASSTAQNTAPSHSSLGGTWDLTVTVTTSDGDTSSTTPRFVFHPDHQLTATGPLGEDGEPEYRGTGFWKEMGNGTFSFYVTHPGREDGAYLGTVQAIHMGRITGSGFATFATTAHAFVTLEEGGVPQGPISVRSVARRVSTGTR